MKMNRIKMDNTPAYLYNYYLYNHTLQNEQRGTNIQNSTDTKAKNTNSFDPQTNNAQMVNKKENKKDSNLSLDSSNSSETSKQQITQIKADDASHNAAETVSNTPGRLDPFFALKRLHAISSSIKE